MKYIWLTYNQGLSISVLLTVYSYANSPPYLNETVNDDDDIMIAGDDNTMCCRPLS